MEWIRVHVRLGRDTAGKVVARVNWDTLHAKVLPSLLGGTSRHPLPAELVRPSNPSSDGAIEMLSLTAQALRFERPSTPESFIVEPEIKDDRKIVADRLRRPLIRLLTAKNATEHPARALARAFDRLRLRPHPFDLPLIDAFVRSHAEKLGATAQHWADRQKPDAGTQSYFDPELLDESNWAQATLSRRAAYLEQRRRDDAGLARALVADPGAPLSRRRSSSQMERFGAPTTCRAPRPKPGLQAQGATAPPARSISMTLPCPRAFGT